MRFEELDIMAFEDEINKELEEELEREKKYNKVQILVDGVIQDEVMLDDNSLEILFETICNCLMYQSGM